MMVESCTHTHCTRPGVLHAHNCTSAPAHPLGPCSLFTSSLIAAARACAPSCMHIQNGCCLGAPHTLTAGLLAACTPTPSKASATWHCFGFRYSFAGVRVAWRFPTCGAPPCALRHLKAWRHMWHGNRRRLNLAIRWGGCCRVG